MEAHELVSAERPKKGIWYVVGSVPLLTEVLMPVLERLQRGALALLLLLSVLLVAAAFVCACLLVPRQQAMMIGTRHCIEYNYGDLPGLDLPERGDDSWFQSWRIDEDDFVCTRVEPHAEEEHNRELFRRFFIDGKLHTSFQMPLRKERVLNPFKRYNRFLKGYISIDLDISNNGTETARNASVRLRLGGRDGGGRQRDWQQLGRAQVPLELDSCQRRTEQAADGTETETECVMNCCMTSPLSPLCDVTRRLTAADGTETERCVVNCCMTSPLSPLCDVTRRLTAADGAETERCVVNQQLFEVASLGHEYYLLNAGVQNMTQPPLSMNLLVVFQTRVYTLVCLHLGACFTAALALLLVLFVLRVRRLYPVVPTGHTLLVLLAAALIVWDVPLGYIALDYDAPWLGIVDAVRQDLFYLVFLCFCLVFVREQAFVKGVKRAPRRLLPPLAPVAAGALLLLALDVTQQALLAADPFAGRPHWLRLCLAVLLVLNALYVLAVCALAAGGWRRGWDRKPVPGRYRALMAITCLTVAAACVEHAERRESDNWWFWSWTDERPTDGHLLYIGMLVWYNVLVAGLLVLYLPTRPLVELTGPVYDDEQKVPLNGGDEPEPIRREAAPVEP
ncbi:Protein wntless [Amphibalanus amphitrite]|uniref:Protein wntless n=1 Tax=Amphibalanus amphitrite TaxID=1232801 RepID=A0A6A4WXL9_AMPAM|nr:Protein wntless [Amphibalanus amphitrite]